MICKVIFVSFLMACREELENKIIIKLPEKKKNVEIKKYLEYLKYLRQRREDYDHNSGRSIRKYHKHWPLNDWYNFEIIKWIQYIIIQCKINLSEFL